MTDHQQRRTAARRPLARSLGARVVVIAVIAAIAALVGLAESPVDLLRAQPASARAGDGVSVWDEGTTSIANLDPALLGALRQAATDAEGDGIQLRVNSGWRSAQHQEQLLRKAISTYGSRKEAARWVATPENSPHVSGEAVDIGPSEATTWLSEHGARYGLCQIYENEPWHYELRPQAVHGGCPHMYADPTHDPRMQQ